MTFGIWVSELELLISLHFEHLAPSPGHLWFLHCSLWGGQSIIFPVTVRSEVKLTQLVARKVNWSKSTGLGELVAISLY